MIKMSGVMRSSLKLYSGSGFMNLFRQTIKPENAKQRLYSTVWSSMKSADNNAVKSTAVWNKYNLSSMQYSTKSENELAEFLEQEISEEQKLQKHKTIPSKIDDFEVKLNGSEVTLVKNLPGETITIQFNINNSVDSVDQNETENVNDGGYTEILSKPDFKIDIKRADTTLGFSCYFSSFGEQDSNDEVAEDVFHIADVTLYKGEWKDTNYKVSAEILDGYLYDLFMNFLDEKGVSNEFVSKLSELSTAYEHSSYISLLRDLKNFASK